MPRKTLTALDPVTLPTELSAVSSSIAAVLEAKVSRHSTWVRSLLMVGWFLGLWKCYSMHYVGWKDEYWKEIFWNPKSHLLALNKVHTFTVPYNLIQNHLFPNVVWGTWTCRVCIYIFSHKVWEIRLVGADIWIMLQTIHRRCCTITEKAPTRPFSWLIAPTDAVIFKTLC